MTIFLKDTLSIPLISQKIKENWISHYMTPFKNAKLHEIIHVKYVSKEHCWRGHELEHVSADLLAIVLTSRMSLSLALLSFSHSASLFSQTRWASSLQDGKQKQRMKLTSSFTFLTNILTVLTDIKYQTLPPSASPAGAAPLWLSSSRRRQRRLSFSWLSPVSAPPLLPPAALPGSCGLPPGGQESYCSHSVRTNSIQL